MNAVTKVGGFNFGPFEFYFETYSLRGPKIWGVTRPDKASIAVDCGIASIVVSKRLVDEGLQPVTYRRA